MKYCTACGTPLEDDAKFCMECGEKCEPDLSGFKARPLHVETAGEVDIRAKKICTYCGTLLLHEAAFCSECGKPCCKVENQDKQAKNGIGLKKPLLLILLGVCAILWLAAPFIAVNLLTFGNQPTALQFITDDIIYLVNIKESSAYWAAVVSLAGIILCFFFVTRENYKATCVIAIFTEIPMAIALYEGLQWSYNGGVLGMGFWGIAILLLIVILVSLARDE